MIIKLFVLIIFIGSGITLIIMYFREKYCTKKWPTDASPGQYQCIDSWAKNDPSGGALNNSETKCFARMKKGENIQLFETKTLFDVGRIETIEPKIKKPGD